MFSPILTVSVSNTSHFFPPLVSVEGTFNASDGVEGEGDDGIETPNLRGHEAEQSLESPIARAVAKARNVRRA